MEITEATVTPIGQRIQELLSQLGKNAAWLAQKVGVPRSTVTRLLSGARNPTADTLNEIAPVLGMTLAQLVAGTDAADRVKNAERLVSRADYEAAVNQVLEYEREVRELKARAREADGELARERGRAERAERDLEVLQKKHHQVIEDRDRAREDALEHARETRRYKNALRTAVADVAALREQIRELGKGMDASHMTAQVAAILAGVAAAVSVANYIKVSDDTD